MEAIPVILIIIVICSIIFVLLKKKNPKPNSSTPTPSTPTYYKKPNLDKAKEAINTVINKIKKDEVDSVTRTRNINGTLVQLADADDRKVADGVVAAFPLGIIPADGICINRPTAKNFIPGQITLKAYRGYEQSISQNAYYIYETDDRHPFIALRDGIEKIGARYYDGDRFIDDITVYDFETGEYSYVDSFYLREGIAFSLGGSQWFAYKAWEKNPPPVASIRSGERKSVPSPEQVFNGNQKRRTPMPSRNFDPRNLP